MHSEHASRMLSQCGYPARLLPRPRAPFIGIYIIYYYNVIKIVLAAMTEKPEASSLLLSINDKRYRLISRPRLVVETAAKIHAKLAETASTMGRKI